MLILITEGFPSEAGSEKTFLSSEIRILAKHFQEIKIMPLSYSGSVSEVPLECTVDLTLANALKKGILHNAISICRYVTRNPNIITKIIKDLIQNKSPLLNPLILPRYFRYILRGVLYSQELSSVIDKLPEDKIIIYTYWFNYSTLAAALIKEKRNIRIVTRAHGYDLYNERSPMRFFPLREYAISNVNQIHTVSEKGRLYLAQKFSKALEKTLISRLGIDLPSDFIPPQKSTQDSISVVSCSSVSEVKQVQRIAEVIGIVAGKSLKKIIWTHYGDGPLMKPLKDFTSTLQDLHRNLDIHLKGQTKNKDVLKSYHSKGFDLFINLSQSEGIPVSIMEAMAYGIPALATNVGGTSELVTPENGYLVSYEDSNESIAQLICSHNASLSNLPRSAQSFVEQNYNSDTNLTTFVNNLQQTLVP